MKRRTPRPAERAADSPDVPPWKLWLVLVLLVWGIFAVDSGLYQDDATQLSVAQEAFRHSGVNGLFENAGTPTRRLLNVVFILPWITGESAWGLQLLTGLLWLATGWIAWRLCRVLLPNDRRVAWIAGTLTICATSDYLTVSPVAVGYLASVLLGLLALEGCLRFIEDGRLVPLALGALAAASSVFVIDGATVGLAMAPALFLAFRGPIRRRLIASIVLCLSLAPYAAIFYAARRDPGSYLRIAAPALALGDRVGRTLRLTARDFSPWEWPRIVPLFGAPPPRLVPVWLWAAGALLALVLILRGLGRWKSRSASLTTGQDLLIGTWCLAATVATHAAWAGVSASTGFYRTQLFSRVLVSALLGLVASRLLNPKGLSRLTGFALVAVFTGFGVAGGLARQDHFLSTWRQHRKELRSIVDAVPEAQAATKLLLVLPHEPTYTAMPVPYLAERWATLLWPDPSGRPSVFLWSEDAGSACVADTTGFRCRPHEQQACFDAGTCPGVMLPWERLIVMTWESDEGRFKLVERVPSRLLGYLPSSDLDYRPRDRIVEVSPPRRVRSLLRGDVGLARFLP